MVQLIIYSIIALMLGRLRMSVVDAIECYNELTKTVFTAIQIGKDGKFKAEVLEDVIKKIVEIQTGTDEERMLDVREDACKTCAIILYSSSIYLLLSQFCLCSSGAQHVRWDTATFPHVSITGIQHLQLHDMGGGTSHLRRADFL